MTHSVYVPGFCAGEDALVVAKGNRIEAWRAGDEGVGDCVAEEVWGMVVGMEWVGGEVSRVRGESRVTTGEYFERMEDSSAASQFPQ